MSEQETLDWPDYLTRGQDEIRRAIECICKKYGAAGEAEDVRGVINMRLWAGKERLHFENRSALFGYIQRAVRYEIPHQRGRATAGGRIQLLDPASLAEVAPTAGDSAADTPSVEELLTQLADEKQREACRLSYEGLTMKEIGERLGVSRSQAFRLLDRAEKILRKKLGVARPAPGRPSDE